MMSNTYSAAYLRRCPEYRCFPLPCEPDKSYLVSMGWVMEAGEARAAGWQRYAAGAQPYGLHPSICWCT